MLCNLAGLINRCYDIRKKQQRITAIEDFEEPSAEDQYNVELKEALGQLDEKYRIVMVLYYSEGYQTGEIAELLEIPEVRFRRGFSGDGKNWKLIIDDVERSRDNERRKKCFEQ